mmetsp:Transcript_22769/g.67031  ORF Transcript_22769/g.67031 Transcript_22769/m.67031 type:complete len:203 (-) Transcript_22769:226-834(-)
MPPSSLLRVKVSRSTSETWRYETDSCCLMPNILCTKPTSVSKTYIVPCSRRLDGLTIVAAHMKAIVSVSGTPSRWRTLSSFLAEMGSAASAGCVSPRGASPVSAIAVDTFCSRCVTSIAIWQKKSRPRFASASSTPSSAARERRTTETSSESATQVAQAGAPSRKLISPKVTPGERMLTTAVRLALKRGSPFSTRTEPCCNR